MRLPFLIGYYQLYLVSSKTQDSLITSIPGKNLLIPGVPNQESAISHEGVELSMLFFVRNQLIEKKLQVWSSMPGYVQSIFIYYIEKELNCEGFFCMQVNFHGSKQLIMELCVCVQARWLCSFSVNYFLVSFIRLIRSPLIKVYSNTSKRYPQIYSEIGTASY